jgi:Fe2+ transport system protein B
MSRVGFLMDKIMRKFGLSGKRCPFDFWNGLRNPAIMADEILKTGKNG